VRAAWGPKETYGFAEYDELEKDEDDDRMLLFVFRIH